MKKIIFFFFVLLCSYILNAQYNYDSVTISRFVERKASGEGWNRITNRNYAADLVDEHRIWFNQEQTESIPHVFSLTERIRDNGAKSLFRCFVPRHSINFYKEGKIARYVLICFQCNGMEFSDMPPEHAGLLLSREVRMQQIEELKILFKDYL
jgi:hypothetical protein